MLIVVNQQVFSWVLVPEQADHMLCECTLCVVNIGVNIRDEARGLRTYINDVGDYWGIMLAQLRRK